MRYTTIILLLLLFIPCHINSKISVKHTPDVDEVYLDSTYLFSVIRSGCQYDTLIYDTIVFQQNNKYHIFGIDDYLEECQIYYVLYNYSTNKLSKTDYISFMSLYNDCPNSIDSVDITIYNDSLYLDYKNSKFSIKSYLYQFPEK